MKVLVKAPFMNSYGLCMKGDTLEVKEKDFDATLMQPEEDAATKKEEPAKKTAGRKKKEA